MGERNVILEALNEEEDTNSSLFIGIIINCSSSTKESITLIKDSEQRALRRKDTLY